MKYSELAETNLRKQRDAENWREQTSKIRRAICAERAEQVIEKVVPTLLTSMMEEQAKLEEERIKMEADRAKREEERTKMVESVFNDICTDTIKDICNANTGPNGESMIELILNENMEEKIEEFRKEQYPLMMKRPTVQIGERLDELLVEIIREICSETVHFQRQVQPIEHSFFDKMVENEVRSIYRSEVNENVSEKVFETMLADTITAETKRLYKSAISETCVLSTWEVVLAKVVNEELREICKDLLSNYKDLGWNYEELDGFFTFSNNRNIPGLSSDEEEAAPVRSSHDLPANLSLNKSTPLSAVSSVSTVLSGGSKMRDPSLLCSMCPKEFNEIEPYFVQRPEDIATHNKLWHNAKYQYTDCTDCGFRELNLDTFKHHHTKDSCLLWKLHGIFMKMAQHGGRRGRRPSNRHLSTRETAREKPSCSGHSVIPSPELNDDLPISAILGLETTTPTLVVQHNDAVTVVPDSFVAEIPPSAPKTSAEATISFTSLKVESPDIKLKRNQEAVLRHYTDFRMALSSSDMVKSQDNDLIISFLAHAATFRAGFPESQMGMDFDTLFKEQFVSNWRDSEYWTELMDEIEMKRFSEGVALNLLAQQQTAAPFDEMKYKESSGFITDLVNARKAKRRVKVFVEKQCFSEQSVTPPPTAPLVPTTGDNSPSSSINLLKLREDDTNVPRQRVPTKTFQQKRKNDDSPKPSTSVLTSSRERKENVAAPPAKKVKIKAANGTVSGTRKLVPPPVKLVLPAGKPVLPAAKTVLPTGNPVILAGRPSTSRPVFPAGKPVIPTGKPVLPPGNPVILASRPSTPTQLAPVISQQGTENINNDAQITRLKNLFLKEPLIPATQPVTEYATVYSNYLKAKSLPTPLPPTSNASRLMSFKLSVKCNEQNLDSTQRHKSAEKERAMREDNNTKKSNIAILKTQIERSKSNVSRLRSDPGWSNDPGFGQNYVKKDWHRERGELNQLKNKLRTMENKKAKLDIKLQPHAHRPNYVLVNGVTVYEDKQFDNEMMPYITPYCYLPKARRGTRGQCFEDYVKNETSMSVHLKKVIESFKDHNGKEFHKFLKDRSDHFKQSYSSRLGLSSRIEFGGELNVEEKSLVAWKPIKEIIRTTPWVLQEETQPDEKSNKVVVPVNNTPSSSIPLFGGQNKSQKTTNATLKRPPSTDLPNKYLSQTPKKRKISPERRDIAEYLATPSRAISEPFQPAVYSTPLPGHRKSIETGREIIAQPLPVLPPLQCPKSTIPKPIETLPNIDVSEDSDDDSNAAFSDVSDADGRKSPSAEAMALDFIENGVKPTLSIEERVKNLTPGQIPTPRRKSRDSVDTEIKIPPKDIPHCLNSTLLDPRKDRSLYLDNPKYLEKHQIQPLKVSDEFWSLYDHCAGVHITTMEPSTDANSGTKKPFSKHIRDFKEIRQPDSSDHYHKMLSLLLAKLDKIQNFNWAEIKYPDAKKDFFKQRIASRVKSVETAIYEAKSSYGCVFNNIDIFEPHFFSIRYQTFDIKLSFSNILIFEINFF